MVVQRTFSRIHFPVAIDIDILQVTCLPQIICLKEREVLTLKVIVHFPVGHEKVVGHESPYLADIHTLIISFITRQTGMIIINDTFRIIILGYNSLIIEQIKTYPIAEPAFQLILPVDGKFPTTVTQSGIVYLCTVVRYNAADGRNSFGRANHIFRRALIGIERYGKTVIEQHQIQTYIGIIHLFPSNVGTYHFRCKRNGSFGGFIACTRQQPCIHVVRVECHHAEIIIKPRTVLVAKTTIGHTYFKL